MTITVLGKKLPRIAIAIQPNIGVTGGGLVVDSVIRYMRHNHDVVPFVFRPTFKFGIKSIFALVKVYTKYLFYGFASKTWPLFLSENNLMSNQFDLILVSWVEDLYFTLLSGVPPEKIIHLCQSIETWGAPPDRCLKAYTANVKRLFVASWMQDKAFGMPGSAVISNCIRDEFLRSVPSTNDKIKRYYITYLSHKGWWKNTAESSIVADCLAYDSKLIPCSLGSGLSSFNKHKSFKRPQLKTIISIFDSTHVFISLSRYEGMPLMVLEAISRGAFVILSRIPAHLEISKLFPRQCFFIDSSPVNFNEINSLCIPNPSHARPSPFPSIEYFSSIQFHERIKAFFEAMHSNEQ